MARGLLVLLALSLAGCGDSRVETCIANLSNSDVQLRRLAARELAELKPADDRSKAALHDALDDPDREVRRLACIALGETGLADTARLVQALEDEELSVRLAAAFAILKCDPKNVAAIAVLRKTMKLGEGGVIVAVTKMGPGAEWAVPTLVGLLRDRRPGIRRLAADGLGKIGASTGEALAALERARADSDDRVRGAAATALARLRRSEGD